MLILNIAFYLGIYLDLWLFECNRFDVSKVGKKEIKSMPNGAETQGIEDKSHVKFFAKIHINQ